MKTIDFNSFTVDNGAIRDLNELLFTSIFNDPDLERTCTMVTDLTNGQKFGMLDSMGDVGESGGGCDPTYSKIKVLVSRRLGIWASGASLSLSATRT